MAQAETMLQGVSIMTLREPAPVTEKGRVPMLSHD